MGKHHQSCRGCYDHRRIVAVHYPAEPEFPTIEWQHRMVELDQPVYEFATVHIGTRHGTGVATPIAVVKQPGRRYGPVPREWAGDGPRAETQPLDQRAREDRYRRQTGRVNRCEAETEPVLDFFPAAERARLLGLTPKQRRRSEKKAWHGDLVLRGLKTGQEAA